MILLDTNALSEPLKKVPHGGFMTRLAAESSLATASICVFELRHGCRKHPHPAKLWARISRDVLSLVTVLPFGSAEAIVAGDIHAALLARGTPIGVEDVAIGATALVQGCAVVTRNARHLSRIPGLRVVDWWA